MGRMPNERDPSGIDQHSPGAKLDAGKPSMSLLQDFGLALRAVAEVGTYGANKYTRGGWQHVENGMQRYSDAMLRHYFAERYSDLDAESGLLHAAQTAWNALARLEIALRARIYDVPTAVIVPSHNCDDDEINDWP